VLRGLSPGEAEGEELGLKWGGALDAGDFWGQGGAGGGCALAGRGGAGWVAGKKGGVDCAYFPKDEREGDRCRLPLGKASRSG